ncbi:hypothetical protein LOK49_LG02G02601 [Camellia lanceoleosa]|uniref:Uncharacterized protein n=1 Tax=Camellia lanceoleosa TaxID=1840588 RepID=A0ACC0IUQ4_9ERIC|nr:hypothetical protein LOK49_LG02G02601 [Camellia lanceoleosa]
MAPMDMRGPVESIDDMYLVVHVRSNGNRRVRHSHFVLTCSNCDNKHTRPYNGVIQLRNALRNRGQLWKHWSLGHPLDVLLASSYNMKSFHPVFSTVGSKE